MGFTRPHAGPGEKPPAKATLQFRDVNTLKVWGEVDGPEHGQSWARRAMAVSPDGRTLAALCGDDGIWLWEVATLQPRLRLDRAGPEDIYRFAFSADGEHLMSNDYYARSGLLWDLFENVKQAKLTEAEMDGLWNDLAGKGRGQGLSCDRPLLQRSARLGTVSEKACRQSEEVEDAERLAARPFDRDVVLARRVVEALERCGTADAADALAALAGRLPYADPAAAAARIRAALKPR